MVHQVSAIIHRHHHACDAVVAFDRVGVYAIIIDLIRAAGEEVFGVRVSGPAVCFHDTDSIPVVGESPGVGGGAVCCAVSRDLLDGGEAVFGVVAVHPGGAALHPAGHVAVVVVGVGVGIVATTSEVVDRSL